MDFRPLFLSVQISFIATVFCFFAGIFAAWKVAAYKGRFRSLIDGVLTVPMVLPPTVTGFFLLVLIGKNSPIGKFFGIWGINLIFTPAAAIIAAVIVSFPLMYRTVRAAFEQIDSTLLSASRSLGAGEVKTFLCVAVPLSIPGIVAGTVLSFARALGEFGATLMVAGNIPGKTQTIPLAIYFAAESGEMHLAGFWVLVITALSFMTVLGLNFFLSHKSGKRRARSAGM